MLISTELSISLAEKLRQSKWGMYRREAHTPPRVASLILTLVFRAANETTTKVVPSN